MAQNGKCNPKKIECLNSGRRGIRTRDKAGVIGELRQTFPLKSLLSYFNMPSSTFYAAIKPHDDKYSKLEVRITQIFHEHKGRYGVRRITAQLRNEGILINHKTVYRLMIKLRLKSVQRQVKYRSYKGTVGKVAPNILQRNFHADKENQKWTTDVTQINIGDKKLYLSPILDMYNGEIISYNISEHPDFAQVMDMLDKAFEKIPDGTNLILHSDQGWQYQQKKYQERLKSKGIVQSMSRKGNCLDNSVMENWFGIMKSELLYPNKYKDVELFKKDLIDYIEYYNNRRIKLKLKGLSPVEYRTKSFRSVS
ncbi:MAG: IS3 family transposase [Treponema sp.]|nr:IS3 family transposase [Treponema sp.]